ncbi:hypothetical protein JW835_03470 [bacterium]|nr:hypothetical protein [bacterium]
MYINKFYLIRNIYKILLFYWLFCVKPIFPQTTDIQNITKLSSNNYMIKKKRSNKNTYTSGFGIGIGKYTCYNKKINSVFGEIPMFHLNLFGGSEKRLALIQISYGYKRSTNDIIYLEYSSEVTGIVPSNHNYFKNIFVTCFNLDFDFLYNLFEIKIFKFVIGSGINLGMLSIKGDLMKGIAGGLIYGDEITDDDAGGGIGLELITGIYINISKYFIQCHAKYQTQGLWYYTYTELPSYKEHSKMGLYNISGFQFLIGIGISY